MKYIVKGHDRPDVDSVISGYLLTKVLNCLGEEAQFIIPDSIDAETLKICNDYGYDPRIFQVNEYDKKANYILVDHFEDDDLNVVGIVDHHKTDKVIRGIDYWYEDASSASVMIARKYEEYLEPFDIMLACLASFVDTVSFNSTRSRESDHDWIKEMCKIYSLDYQRMYKTGLCLTDITDLNLAAFNGIKKYVIGDYHVEASYIQVREITEEQIAYVLEILKKHVIQNKLKVFAFIVYDFESFKTRVYKVFDDNIEIQDYSKYAARGDVVVADIRRTLSKKNH